MITDFKSLARGGPTEKGSFNSSTESTASNRELGQNKRAKASAQKATSKSQRGVSQSPPSYRGFGTKLSSKKKPPYISERQIEQLANKYGFASVIAAGYLAIGVTNSNRSVFFDSSLQPCLIVQDDDLGGELIDSLDPRKPITAKMLQATAKRLTDSIYFLEVGA